MLRAIILFAFLAFAPGSVVAVERCEQCTREEMFSIGQSVVTRGAWNDIHYPVYVVNFTDGLVIKVAYANNVDERFDWERDEFESWGVSVEVEPSVSHYVSAMHDVMPSPIFLTAGSLSVRENVDWSASSQLIPASVYDAISGSVYDIAIHNRLNSSLAGYRQAWYNAVSVYNPVAHFNPSAITPPVMIVFSDGTYAYYAWSPGVSQWKRINGSGRDRFGNRVPEGRQEVAAGGYSEYLFPTQCSLEMSRFIYYLNDLGVSFSSGGGSGNVTKLACTSAGETVICRIVQV